MATLGNTRNTAEIIGKYQFHFQKKYGQNFLIDSNILDKIIESAQLTKDDCVLEIGPGIGTMTQYLSDQGRKDFTRLYQDTEESMQLWSSNTQRYL